MDYVAGGQDVNAGAVSVPLVALACQGGTVELVDTAANAITSSFSVHNNQTVRGVRWLGNTRLVSFSYTEVFCFSLPVVCMQAGIHVFGSFLLSYHHYPCPCLRTLSPEFDGKESQ